jgi:hypothetical protein
MHVGQNPSRRRLINSRWPNTLADGSYSNKPTTAAAHSFLFLLSRTSSRRRARPPTAGSRPLARPPFTRQPRSPARPPSPPARRWSPAARHGCRGLPGLRRQPARRRPGLQRQPPPSCAAPPVRRLPLLFAALPNAAASPRHPSSPHRRRPPLSSTIVVHHRRPRKARYIIYIKTFYFRRFFVADRSFVDSLFAFPPPGGSSGQSSNDPSGVYL